MLNIVSNVIIWSAIIGAAIFLYCGIGVMVTVMLLNTPLGDAMRRDSTGRRWADDSIPAREFRAFVYLWPFSLMVAACCLLVWLGGLAGKPIGWLIDRQRDMLGR